jgi:type II secretory pathway component PulF
MSLAAIFRQLAALLESGVSGAQALEMVAREQAELQQASRYVDQGQTMGRALRAAKVPWPSWIFSWLHLGECSGGLAGICHDLAERIPAQARRHRQYGALVGSAAIIIIGLGLAIAFFFLGIAPPPWFVTLLLVGLLGKNWLSLDLSGAAWLAGLPHGRAIATAERQRQVAAIAIPLGHGLALGEALALVIPLATQPALRIALKQAQTQLNRGQSLGQSLKNTLPKTAIALIQTGETSGQLPQMLDKLSENATVELDLQLRQITQRLNLGAIAVIALLIVLLGIDTLQQLANPLIGE